MIKSQKLNINIFVLISVGFLVALSNLLNYEKKLTVISILFILLLFFILRKGVALSQKKFEKIEFNLENRKKSILTFIFLLLVILQNFYLNFETITWDISSYLVASQEIENKLLPFSTQWESKGPLNSIVYYLFSFISNKNYVIFKIINDILIFLIGFNFFIYLQKTKKEKFLNYFSLIFLIILFSSEWYVSEFTEFYCLFLISIAQLIYIKDKNLFFKYFLIGFIYSLASLINQGSIIIFAGFIFYLLINKSLKNNIKQYSYLVIGFLIPYSVTLLIYSYSDLLEVLIANYIFIPLGYTGSNASSIYELRVFLREFYDYNIFIYFTIISIFIALFVEIVNDFKIKIVQIFKDLDYILLIFSILYYFIAGHNYYHHLIYALYFFCIAITKLSFTSSKQLIAIMVTFSVLSNLYFYSNNSFKNLSNLSETYNSYPLKGLSSEIESYFETDDFNVLALDYILILYYLDKPSYSYIIHPTNHYQEYITRPLQQIGLVEKNEIQKLFKNKPDVIICNSIAIDNGGQVINVDPLLFGQKIEEGQVNSCSLDYLGKNYFLLDTSKYRNNPNLSYYKDPYKDMNVFIIKRS